MFKKHFLLKLIFGLIPLIVIFFIFNNRSYSQVNENSSQNPNDTITLRTLHNELDTAGTWVKVTKEQIDPDEKGENNTLDNDINTEYVWVPNYTVIDPDWNPYTNGQWVWCDFGWTWVSSYSWGWLPYHYGRWWYSGGWGWVWSPGYTWAPCWVDWYWNYGYIGWYPISPYYNWHWDHGCVVSNHHGHHGGRHNGGGHNRKWTFVKENDFTKKLTKYDVADVKGNKQIFSEKKYDGKPVEKGPDVKQLQTKTGEKIVTKNIVLANETKKVAYNEKTVKTKFSANDVKKVSKESVNKVFNNTKSTLNNKKSNQNNNTGNKSVNKKSSNNNNSTKGSNNNTSTKKSSNNTSTKGSNNNTSTKGSNNNTSTKESHNNTSKSSNNNSNSKGSYNKSNSSYNGSHGNSSNTRSSSNSGSHNSSNNSGRSSNSGRSGNSGHRR